MGMGVVVKIAIVVMRLEPRVQLKVMGLKWGNGRRAEHSGLWRGLLSTRWTILRHLMSDRIAHRHQQAGALR